MFKSDTNLRIDALGDPLFWILTPVLNFHRNLWEGLNNTLASAVSLKLFVFPLLTVNLSLLVENFVFFLFLSFSRFSTCDLTHSLRLSIPPTLFLPLSFPCSLPPVSPFRSFFLFFFLHSGSSFLFVTVEGTVNDNLKKEMPIEGGGGEGDIYESN